MRPYIVIFSLLALTRAVPLPQQQHNPTQKKPVWNTTQLRSSHQEQQSPAGQTQNSQSQHSAQVSPQHQHPADQTAAATSVAQEKDSQVAGTSILENPHYDPSLYQTFIPQDAVQQYVNYFGTPYIPYTNGANGVPQPIPYAVQTGYEGFIVPELPQQSTQIIDSAYPGLWTYVKGIILPKFILAWVLKSAAVILSTLGVVFFGGAVTTALCSLTPLCTIRFSSFPLFKWKDTAEAVGKAIGAEITPERVRRTAELVQAAIEKYSAMQIPENNIQKIK